MTLIRDRAVGQDTEQSLKPVKRHRSLFWVQLWEETQRTRSGRLNRRSTDSDSASFKLLFEILPFYTTLYLSLFFSSVCVCMYVHTRACVCAHTCVFLLTWVWTHLWMSKDHIKHWTSPFTLNDTFGVCCCILQVTLPGSFRDFPCLHLPPCCGSDGIPDVHYHVSCAWMLEIWTWAVLTTTLV